MRWKDENKKGMREKRERKEGEAGGGGSGYHSHWQLPWNNSHVPPLSGEQAAVASCSHLTPSMFLCLHRLTAPHTWTHSRNGHTWTEAADSDYYKTCLRCVGAGSICTLQSCQRSEKIVDVRAVWHTEIFYIFASTNNITVTIKGLKKVWWKGVKLFDFICKGLNDTSTSQ